MIDEIDYIQEDEITCPYCGNKNIDSWEVGKNVNDGELGTQECDDCGKKFIASRNMSITYTSHPAPCLNGEKEHDWRKMIGVPEEYFKGKYRCNICNKEEKLKEDLVTTQ